jgi:hypothetical protein
MWTPELIVYALSSQLSHMSFRRLRFTLLLALLGATTAPGASAQAPDSLIAVELAVAVHLRGEPGQRGPIALDPVQWNVHSPNGRGAKRAEGHTLSLAEALGAAVRELPEILSCPNGPPSCSLGGFSAHIMFGQPVVLGDAATVEVVRRWLSESPSTPVAYSRSEYRLQRTSQGWRVVGRRGKVVS